MNRFNFWMLLLSFLLVGTVSDASDSGRIETISTGDVNSGWKIPFHGSKSKPVVHDGTIYIGSFDGGIYAIDPKNGNQIWQYQTGIGLTSGPEIIQSSGQSFGDMAGAALQATERKGKGKREIWATPVIKGNTVYVGSRDHNFYALDANTGKLKWATNIGNPIVREALFSGENIIVHGQYAVYVLRKKDGQVMWSTEGKGSATYPFSNGKVVYYGISDDKNSSNFFMNAVELNTGKLLWALELQGKPSKSVYGSVDLVYATASKGGQLIYKADNTVTSAPTVSYVYAVNASTGKLVWELTGGEVRYTSPPLVIDSKYIFFTAKKGLYALDKTTGKQDWFLEGNYSSSNITMGEFLYVLGGSGDDHIYAINPKTGKMIWNYADKNIWHTKVVGNTVYISAEQSQVALNSATGKKLWKFKTGGFFKPGAQVSASPLIFQNNVIFPTRTNMIWGEDNIQGHLYSIDARTGKVK